MLPKVNFAQSRKIIVSMGDPAGIGPDIIIKSFQHKLPIEWVVVGDQEVIQRRAALLSIPLEMEVVNGKNLSQDNSPNKLKLINHPLKFKISPGKPDSRSATYILETLEIATAACLQGNFRAMVTCPINKALIQEAGYEFMGHSEFLASKANVSQIVMMLVSDTLRVALATTHIPLSLVSKSLKTDSLIRTIVIIHKALSELFQIPNPKILVCGLNPHAGEDGHIGTEEITIIKPAIETCKKLGIDVSDPCSADTIYLQKSDAILAMYHDQGLPVIKTLQFGHIANVTLGLPFIRTSVDHGTAYALAGTNKVNENSLCYAITLAHKLSDVKNVL